MATKTTTVKEVKSDTVVKSKKEDVDFYNQHEGSTGRQFGIYGDEEENVAAEETRAFKEDRDPDYDNPGATAGTPLVVKAILDQTVNPSSVNVPSENLDEPEPMETLPVDRA